MIRAQRSVLLSVLFAAALGCGGDDTSSTSGDGGAGGASTIHGAGASGPAGSGGGAHAGGSGSGTGGAGGGTASGGSGPGGGGHGGSGHGGGPSGGSGGGTGGAGGALPDTCPVPAGGFTVETVASGSTDVILRRAALQTPTNEPPHLFTTRNYGNGSFYNELLERYTKSGANWLTTTINDEEWGFSVATALDAIGGDDPCLVYTDDYDGQVRLVCNSLTDRVVAPGAATDLAVGAFGATKHVARVKSQVQIEWLTTDGGDPTVPEAVDDLRETYSLSMAVDATGRPHLAYETFMGHDAAGYHFEIRHAVRAGGAWTITTVDSEIAATAPGDYNNVSMALDPNGRPWIAYHRRSTRSMSLVTGLANGFSSPVSLGAPQPGYPNDDIGDMVRLVIDCYGRGRLLYSRSITTDPTPNSHVYHALVSPSGLTEQQMVGTSPGTYFGNDYTIAYQVDAAGHDHIASSSPGQLAHIYR